LNTNELSALTLFILFPLLLQIDVSKTDFIFWGQEEVCWREVRVVGWLCKPIGNF